MAGFTRRTVVTGMAGALLTPLAARAQSWPSGPIRIIVPFPAGGSVDAVARLAQAGLQQRLGTTIVVENRSGASGSTGTAIVAKSPPDGNTWLLTFDNHAVNPALLPNFPFDNQKDLEPVTLVGTAPYMVATNPAKPYKTLADVIAAAKKAPGKISYGSVGSGSIGHLAMVLLGKQAGIELTHVPYRGGAPAVNDALAGHIDLVNGSVALLTPHVAAGRLRPVWQHGAQTAPRASQPCRRSAKPAFPAPRPMPGGASTRRRRPRRRSSTGSAPPWSRACARTRRRACSPRASR